GIIRIFTDKPEVPIISGDAILCPIINGLIYSVPENPSVLSYTWSVPDGFNITAGAGTHQITVNATSNAKSGNVGVIVSNSCGSSSATFAVNVDTFASADAGQDIYVCTGTASVTMNGEVGGVIKDNQSNTYSWTDNGAGGSFSAPGNTKKTQSIYTLPTNAM